MSDLVPEPSDEPGHYRLSAEIWALILKEYREGATAAALARKWRVSMSAIRKQITRAGASKRDWGDAQVIEQAALRETTLAEARANGPEARAARLFDDLEAEPVEAGDPVALARVAALASGRAMRERLWVEARALTLLAESYQRMAAADQARGDGTLETLPLQTLMEIRLASEERVGARFQISPRPGVQDPDRDVKDLYWRMASVRAQMEEATGAHAKRLMAHVGRLERLMRQGGLTPPVFTAEKATIAF